MLDKFAEELKQKRIESGISLQQMAVKSRIDLKFLQAIEDGNFSFLPDLYVKAFIKEYAKFVDLDAEETIKKFEAAKKGVDYNRVAPALPKENEGKNEPAKPEIPEEQIPNVTAPPPKHFDSTPFYNNSQRKSPYLRKKNIMLIATILGILAIAVLIWLLFFNNKTEIIVPEKPIDEVIQQNSQRYEEEKPEIIRGNTTTAYSTPGGDSLSLRILARDTTWIKLFLDDRQQEEFILFPKSQKEIRAAKNFKLVVGNGAGVNFLLNNHNLKYTGKKKEVVNLQIDSSGIKYLTQTPSLH